MTPHGSSAAPGAAVGKGRTQSERLHGEHRRAVHEIGHLLASEGKFEAARNVFEGWLSLEPNDPYSHLALGWIHRQKGRRSEARASLRRVLERATDSSQRPSDAGSGTRDSSALPLDLGWRAALALAELEMEAGTPEVAAQVLGDRIRWSGGVIPHEIAGRVSMLLELASS
ncbi:MAG: tetratricopeptide repeat protein [Candidatus Eisenbacteria bacterium]|nr:tetratricopeptide repeat protein [Candidatus Eisenbacteria bacterium]